MTDPVFAVPVVRAVIVTVVLDTTLWVVTWKVALVVPARTVTFAGTEPTGTLLLESVTRAPPGYAAEARVTVPVEGVPAVTLGGLKVTVETAGAGGLTVRTAVLVVPEKMPEIVTAVEAGTDSVPTVMFDWDDRPAAIVTVAGTVADEVFELERLTTTPPGGAMPVSVTVRLDQFAPPPTMIAGFRLRLERAAGFTVKTAVFAAPVVCALIVGVAAAATPSVVMGNVVLVEPAGTVTVAGTVAAVVTELERDTIVPPVGAADGSVTVPVELVPLTTVVGERVRLATGGGGGLIVRVAVFGMLR
jgi:hypothetical protein